MFWQIYCLHLYWKLTPSWRFFISVDHFTCGQLLSKGNRNNLRKHWMICKHNVMEVKLSYSSFEVTNWHRKINYMGQEKYYPGKHIAFSVICEYWLRCWSKIVMKIIYICSFRDNIYLICCKRFFLKKVYYI